MKRILLGINFFLILLLSISAAAEKRALTFDDFIKIKRISDVQLSPNGKEVVFVITEINKEENRSNNDIWLMKIDGMELRQLTTSEKNDFKPRWSPDGKIIAFLSNRDGKNQVWMINRSGGEAYKITDTATGVTDFIWSPDGKFLLYAAEVYPECADDKCNKEKEENDEKSKVKAVIYDKLFIRHWDEWRTEKRSHLFLFSLENKKAKDITPGRYDAPPIALGSDKDFVFSPEGKEIAFVMNKEEMIAASTNNDIFLYDITGGETKKLTESKGNDNSPRYSPDGNYIAYLSMERPGFEADKYNIILYNRKTKEYINLTKDFELSAENIEWSSDSKYIYFTCSEKAYRPLYRLSLKDRKIEKLIEKANIINYKLSSDNKFVILEKEAVNMPRELFLFDLSKRELKQISQINKKILENIEMNSLEEFWFNGAEGDKVHGLLLKPPFFDRGKKYPLVMLIHGGPQGAWEDEFHYRWNAQMFAAAGYVIAMINFHGSTGYGQSFTDSISRDWGGKPYEDIMKGLDYLLDNYEFIDKENICAAGASYGGYMINWIEGHTNKFKCLISHAGVYDLRSEYGSTEELWFPEWEFRGTPWENPELYEKFSPSYYVKNFTTPCLVIHGGNDFRVPLEQGIQMFTALQRKGIPSRFLYFPDETHFVQKPQNAELWWKTVYEWLSTYLKNK